MKFLWLDINASYSHSSLALPSLEAQIGEHTGKQIEWQVVSGTIKSNKDEIISQIISYSPNYIFATGWLFNIEYLISVLRKTNALLEHCKIVLGGPEFLGDNQRFLQENQFVTAVFKGDGEEVFSKMAEIVVNDNNSLEWLSLPGFEYLKEDLSGYKKYIQKDCVKCSDFCNLKAPEESQFFNWDKAFVQLETSRGCFNSCRFCVSGIDNSPVQNIPIHTIRERLKHIASKGIKEIRILDRTFNANAKRATDMLMLFEEFEGILKFHLEVHPALLNDGLKEKLSHIPANLLHVEAGIQSLNDNVIENCRRKGRCENAINGLKFLLSSGKFEVHTDFIAGLPEYSYNMLVEDICKMISLHPHEIQLELLKLLPGTYFRDNSDKLGIKFSPEPPYEVLQTPAISFDELCKSMVISKMIDYWYNDESWRTVFGNIATKECDFINKFADHLYKTAFMEHTYSFEGKSNILYQFCKNEYPQYLINITLGWIKNGLSIKKEPAGQLKMWHFTNNTINNPVLEENNVYNCYYYLDYKDERHWFVFNKHILRDKPITYFKEIITKS